jgi:hypothetical protein
MSPAATTGFIAELTDEMERTTNEPCWRKSSYSGGGANGECVEVATGTTGALVRNTKDRDGGFLTLSREAWKALVARPPVI